MIQKITFTGREEMLTKVGKQAESAMHKYISAGHCFPKSEVNAAQKLASQAKLVNDLPSVNIYTSPFAPIGSISKNANQANAGQKIDFLG